MRAVADLLAMDRTTLTAALKPLEKQGLLIISIDPNDRRGRRLTLTETGLKALAAALPTWEKVHAEIEANLPEGDPDRLRRDLRALT
jgi:DNA-binding MarR family transcriptional regulator